jgi:tetratricopeptide (TPR) repeat protein
MQLRRITKTQLVRAALMLVIAGPSPHRHRWGRWLVANALRLALRCLHQNDAQRAIPLLELTAKVAPMVSLVQISLANALLAVHDRRAARNAVSAAIRAAPQSPASISRIVSLQLLLDERDSPQGLLDSALRRFPESPVLLKSLGRVYAARSQFDEAEQIFRRAAQLAPTISSRLIAMLNVGECLESAGRKEAAMAQYREIIAIAPRDYRAYCRLAFCQPGPDTENELTNVMISLPHVGGTNEQMEFHYALGQLYDRAGRAAHAFAHFHIANEKRAAAVGRFNVEDLRTTVDGRVEIFSSKMIADLSRYGCEDDGPVFVVGMPRSGTSLVEQILSSHSAVRALGEREDVWRLTQTMRTHLRSRKKYPWCASELSPSSVRSLSSSLAQGLRKHVRQESRFVTKLPEDFWDLGLIAILLPKAHIVHCRRHPIDTCLSCYMQSFEGLKYAVNLENLAAVYQLYERMMEHWRTVLPTQIFEVQYEKLVHDAAQVVPELCTFCGLTFEQKCLQFHQNQRNIDTASRWQVRKPLYGTSVGRWKQYQQFLGPLMVLGNLNEGEPTG